VPLISWLYASFPDFHPFVVRVITWIHQRRFPTPTSSFLSSSFLRDYKVFPLALIFKTSTSLFGYHFLQRFPCTSYFRFIVSIMGFTNHHRNFSFFNISSLPQQVPRLLAISHHFPDFHPLVLRVITWMHQRRFPTSLHFIFFPLAVYLHFFVIAKSLLFAGRVSFQQVSHILAIIS
jgi:hypothetical protein